MQQDLKSDAKGKKTIPANVLGAPWPTGSVHLAEQQTKANKSGKSVHVSEEKKIGQFP